MSSVRFSLDYLMLKWFILRLLSCAKMLWNCLILNCSCIIFQELHFRDSEKRAQSHTNTCTYHSPLPLMLRFFSSNSCQLIVVFMYTWLWLRQTIPSRPHKDGIGWRKDSKDTWSFHCQQWVKLSLVIYPSCGCLGGSPAILLWMSEPKQAISGTSSAHLQHWHDIAVVFLEQFYWFYCSPKLRIEFEFSSFSFANARLDKDILFFQAIGNGSQ